MANFEKGARCGQRGGKGKHSRGDVVALWGNQQEIFPALAAHRKSKAAATSEQELSHFKAISDEVFPKEAKRKAASVQTAQGMLSRYSKLNDLVFPKEGKARHVQVQDV